MSGCFKVTLGFCFGPKPKFCSFDLDLDQAEQFVWAVVKLTQTNKLGTLKITKNCLSFLFGSQSKEPSKAT